MRDFTWQSLGAVLRRRRLFGGALSVWWTVRSCKPFLNSSRKPRFSSLSCLVSLKSSWRMIAIFSPVVFNKGFDIFKNFVHSLKTVSLPAVEWCYVRDAWPITQRDNNSFLTSSLRRHSDTLFSDLFSAVSKKRENHAFLFFRRVQS